MMTLRKSDDRGRGQHGWLDSRHSFSFGNYHDPAHTGFGDLLVINEDRVAGGAGFGTHGHKEMEIISYVLEGALEHKDSIGSGAVIRPGDIQRMSAGTGIRHSEFNASSTEPVHFLQIWIRPDDATIPPGYEQKVIGEMGLSDAPLVLLASPDGREDSATIHADVALYRATPQPGAAVELALAPGRRAWVQAVRGGATVNGVALAQGDGLAVADEATLRMVGAADRNELLVFDLV